MKFSSVILKYGGLPSHHHGLGKLKSPNIETKRFTHGLLAMKQGFDPSNTFGAQNGVYNNNNNNDGERGMVTDNDNQEEKN